MLREAVQQQDLIGWWSFLQGRITQKFEHVMEEHYKQITTKKKHNKWMEPRASPGWSDTNGCYYKPQ